MELTWSIGVLAAMAGLILALLIVAWACRVQASVLSKLALRKPYWLIEVDERGVRQITKLDNPEARREQREDRTYGPNAMELDEDAELLVGMSPDDEPIELGERRA